MPSRAIRIVLLAVSATVTLVLLPVTINFATNGKQWAWPAAGVLGVVAVSLTVWELVRRRSTINRRVPDDPRNRPKALSRVDHYVEERLRNSLAEKVRIALALDDRPDAVIRLTNLRVQPVDGEGYRIEGPVEIDSVFATMEESLLILGAPGAGKTTLLLDLAGRLVAAARKDPSLPIPVLVDLARWSGFSRARSRRGNPAVKEGDDFLGWLLEVLHDRYGIPPVVGYAWLIDGRLTLLLDGLDEVAKADQQGCVDKLNLLQDKLSGPQLAVCSREEDYFRLSQKLHMQGAVTIRPLTRAQVLDYFSRSEGRLEQVRTALEQDAELWDLLSSPLMLNVMALAYHDRAAGVIRAGDDQRDRRRALFDAYVVEVLARRRAPAAGYAPEQTIRSLAFQAALAPQAGGLPRPVRLGHPRPLDVGAALTAHVLPAALGSAIAGVVLAATLLLGGFAGLVAACGCLAIVATVGRDGASRVRSDRPALGRASMWLLAGVIGGFVLSAVMMLLGAWLGAWHAGLPADWRMPALFVAVAVVAAMVTKAGFLVLLPGALMAWQVPEVGLSAELLSGAWTGLAGAVALGLIIDCGRYVRAGVRTDRLDRRTGRLGGGIYALAGFGVVPLAWALGVPFGVPEWFGVLGLSCGLLLIPDFRYPDSLRLPGLLSKLLALNTFRLALTAGGYRAPRWNRFLRYASDRNLLVEANGEVRFVHALIENHFANCDPDLLAAQVRQRMAQLMTPPAPLPATRSGR